MNNLTKDQVEVYVRVESPEDSVTPEPSGEFVATAHVQNLAEHALSYLEVGYAVHLAGPAGAGKTTLAFHLAALLRRPVVLIHGDDEFGSSDLVGKDSGYRRSKLVDNYIRSVVRTEEDMNTVWVDNRLTTACQKGYTLIYDEFNRSRPEANNALLSVLEERILNLPSLRRSGEGYLEVHPNFRAIFTSNPEEYAGVHKTQDALLDRLITINVGHFDRESEVRITMSRSGIGRADAEVIVDIVRDLRGVGVRNHRPTIRACIAIAKILAFRGAHASADDPVFNWVSNDVLNANTAKITHEGASVMQERVAESIARVAALTTPGRHR